MTIIGGVLRQAARTRYRAVLNGSGFRARDVPAAARHVAGAHRVMLLGSGVSSGWGVATHQLALTGLLRDALQERVGTPFDVELVGDEVMTVTTAPDWLGARARLPWDAVVVALGVNDAVRLTPIRQWEHDYRELVGMLRAQLGDRVPLVVAGLPPISSLVPLQGPFAAVTAAHAQRMNLVLQEIALEVPGVTHVALPRKATEADRPWGSPAAYRPWARTLATAVLEVLPDEAAHRAPVPEPALRPLTRQLMQRAYGTGNPVLQRIVEEASAEFGAAAVQVNLLDGDRVWVTADSTRGAITELPRRLTYCDVTMRQGELHVPDARADARFRDNTLLELTGLGAYAGIVVRGPDGSPVGTVCMFNGSVPAGVDRPALAALGRRVEAGLAAEDDPSSARDAALSGGLPPDDAQDSPTLAGYALLRTRGAALSRAARRGRDAPPPSPPLRVPGPDPIRVLLFGGEYAVGYGAPSRQAALDGAIADLLHEHTGRGVIVQNRSDDAWRLADLADRVGTGQHDLVVWTPLFAEAARSVSLRPWRTGIEAMIVRLRAASDPGIVLLGIPALLGTAPMAVVSRWRARQIEQVLRRVADEHLEVLVVEPPSVRMRDLATVSGTDVFHDVAVRALPAMLEALRLPVRRADAQAVPAGRRA